VRLSDGRRGVVASVPPDKLDHPVVRIGWDAGGASVSPYEVAMASEPGLLVSCVAGPGAEEVEHLAPPLPTRPEPSAEGLEAMRRSRTAPVADAGSRRVSRVR
jgi:hypothetical protein